MTRAEVKRRLVEIATLGFDAEFGVSPLDRKREWAGWPWRPRQPWHEDDRGSVTEEVSVRHGDIETTYTLRRIPLLRWQWTLEWRWVGEWTPERTSGRVLQSLVGNERTRRGARRACALRAIRGGWR